MSTTIIDLNELKAAKRKARFREWKMKVSNGIRDFMHWCTENQTLLVGAVPAICGVLNGTMRFVKKNYTVRQEKHLKEDYVYDRSSGRYLKPTRKLSKREWREVMRRKAAGEKYVNIFDDMKVL